MRIFSDDEFERVTEIKLRLKSTERALNLYTEPLPFDESNRLERSNSASIVFRDLREIDSLISVLQQFRDRNVRYIGDWR